MKKWAEDLSRHCSREQVRMAVRLTKSRPRSPVSRERQSKTAARYRPHLSERPSPVNQRAASVGEDGERREASPVAGGLGTGAAATENSEKVSRNAEHAFLISVARLLYRGRVVWASNSTPALPAGEGVLPTGYLLGLAVPGSSASGGIAFLSRAGVAQAPRSARPLPLPHAPQIS